MTTRSFLAETFDKMLLEQLPNFFRLYLNPYVVQTCVCLERLAHEAGCARSERLQSFLANSFDEALSGAIKLARYCASTQGRPTTGVIIDPDKQLGPFASANTSGENVEFLPGISVVVTEVDLAAADKGAPSFIVLMPGVTQRWHLLASEFAERNQALFIACIDRMMIADVRPDIVVFDESFVHREVPFGAFTARKSLFDHWNTSAKSTFHSTTFQPNTISTLHFLRCLEHDEPKLHAELADDLRLIELETARRQTLLRELYSPSLSRAIAATKFDTANIRTAGDFVEVEGRRVFDGVSGVACSVRGHNPSSYAADIDALASVDCEAELATRLTTLTGLDHLLPAVSGASAIEIALKIGLVAQFPRRHIIALKSGFGGKTLFALTGTWNSSYKENIDPLYPHVLYVDPFATDAIAQIESLLAKHDVALVQVELVQGVGGVRRVPEAVIRHLAENRQTHGYLLLIDEVQTGVHRTGPFVMSSALGLGPDLLVIGKAISDMMFPFALTLYSTAVQAKLERAGSDLPSFYRTRHGYAHGYKTALNVLRFAERTQLSTRVTEAGALFERMLKQELEGCEAVRDVRVFGLLIGIELDATKWPQRWFRRKLFWFYLASMLKHPRYPVLVGFCQYEPNVLKITPPLTVADADIRQICATIGEVLRRPFPKLLASAWGGLLHAYLPWRSNHGRAEQPTDASANR